MSASPTVTTSPWLSLQCPACEKAVRVRRAMADGVIDCPFCDREIDVGQADIGEIEDRRPKRKPTPKRKILSLDALARTFRKPESPSKEKSHSRRGDQAKSPAVVAEPPEIPAHRDVRNEPPATVAERPDSTELPKIAPLTATPPPEPKSVVGEGQAFPAPAKIEPRPIGEDRKWLERQPTLTPKRVVRRPPLPPKKSRKEPPKESLQGLVQLQPPPEPRKKQVTIRVKKHEPKAATNPPGIGVPRFQNSPQLPVRKITTTKQVGDGEIVISSKIATGNVKKTSSETRSWRRISGIAAIFFTFLGMGAALAISLMQPGSPITETPQPLRAELSRTPPPKSQDVSGPIQDWERDAFLELSRKYFTSDSLEERISLVRRSSFLKPIIIDWEKRHPFQAKQVTEFRNMKLGDDPQRRFLVAIADTSNHDPMILFAESAGGALRLDWELCVGYQPVELSDFRKEKPKEPVSFRVKIRLSDYYNYQFADNLEFQSLELYYPGQPDFRLFGFVRRDAAIARDLIPELEINENNRIDAILSLRFPDQPIADDMVEIVGIEQKSWFR